MHTLVAIIPLYTSINKFSDYVMYTYNVLGLMHVFIYTDKVLTSSFTLHEMNSYLPTYNQSLWSRFRYICKNSLILNVVSKLCYFINIYKKFLFVGTLLFPCVIVFIYMFKTDYSTCKTGSWYFGFRYMPVSIKYSLKNMFFAHCGGCCHAI